MTDHINIRVWMLRNKIIERSIAEDVGCTQAHISMVIRGKRKSKNVVDAFIRRGCPDEYFENKEGGRKDYERYRKRL